MSDDTPTSPQPTAQPTPPADGAADATVVQPAATGTEGAAAGSGGAGKKIGFGIAGALVVAAIGGGAYAFTQLSGGGAQPHDVLPADTVAYVRLDLDPSASQKVDLFRLAKRVPDLSKELGIEDEDDDLRKLVLEDALGDCKDVDYDRDVEPWLGERIGLGIGSNFEDEEEVIRIAVQVSDEDAAKKGIAKLFACNDEEYGIGFLDGYAIVTPSQKSATAAVKAAEKKPLADVEQFTAAQDALDEQGVMSGWVDVKSGVEAAKKAGIDEELGGDAAELDQITDEVSSVAFALSASSTSLHFDAVARQGDEPSEVPEIRGLGALPEDTVVGLTVPGGGKAVEENWDELKSGVQDLLELGPALGFVPGLSGGAAAGPVGPPVEFDADAYAADPEGYQQEYLDQLEQQSSGGGLGGSQAPDVEDTLAEIEQTLDVTLPEDLVTLLGDAFTVYVGSEGLETLASAQGPSDPSEVSTGLVMEGDEAKASDLAGRLVATVQKLAGVEIATADGDDAVSLATSPKVAESLVKDGGLGDSDRFSSVIDEDAKGGGLFVDVSTILDTVENAEPDLAEDEVFTGLRNIEAVGISGTRPDDGYRGFSLAVAFTEKK